MTTDIFLVSGLRMLEGIATLLHRLHGVVFNTTGGQLRLALKQTLISQNLLRVIINLSLISIFFLGLDLIRILQ